MEMPKIGRETQAAVRAASGKAAREALAEAKRENPGVGQSARLGMGQGRWQQRRGGQKKTPRTGERRGGEEGRDRGGPAHLKKKKKERTLVELFVAEGEKIRGTSIQSRDEALLYYHTVSEVTKVRDTFEVQSSHRLMHHSSERL